MKLSHKRTISQLLVENINCKIVTNIVTKIDKNMKVLNKKLTGEIPNTAEET